MSTKEVVTKEGIVKEAIMGGLFKVVLLEDESIVVAALSGKLRKFRIRILPGDRVKMEFSPHDVTRGRITLRFRGNENES